MGETMKPPKDTVLRLVERVVTGNGEQLENLSMSDDEWRIAAEQMFGAYYVDHFTVTMRFEDWLTMVRLSRLARIAAAHGTETGEIAVPAWADLVADMSSAASSLRRVVLSCRFNRSKNLVLTSFAELIQGWVDRLASVVESL